MFISKDNLVSLQPIIQQFKITHPRALEPELLDSDSISLTRRVLGK